MTKRRSLSTRERTRLFMLHGGRCHFCNGKIAGALEKWEISHEIPLELGGADDDENRKPAHYKCHRAHTAEVDIPRIAKAKRTHAKHIGAFKRSGRPMDGSRASQWKRKMDGTIERRG
jgi:5-methylcytosine-specific restriction enzyme A